MSPPRRFGQLPESANVRKAGIKRRFLAVERGRTLPLGRSPKTSGLIAIRMSRSTSMPSAAAADLPVSPFVQGDVEPGCLFAGTQ